MGTRCADHMTPLYPQKLALTSPTGGGRSVGIVRSRTKATEFNMINTVRPLTRITPSTEYLIGDMCGWNNYYRHGDLRMVSDRLKIRQNKVLNIAWEGGTRKQVITRLLKSASCLKHVFLYSLKLEIILENVQKYISFFT